MVLQIVALEQRHLDKILTDSPCNLITPAALGQAYFSPGSVAYCLLADGEPVFAAGIVNLQWQRGEAWLLSTAFFRQHVKTCFRILREWLPAVAASGKFIRVQVTCKDGFSEKLIERLGFEREATLRCFGPRGETCSMYARFFPGDVAPGWVDRAPVQVASA